MRPAAEPLVRQGPSTHTAPCLTFFSTLSFLSFLRNYCLLPFLFLKIHFVIFFNSMYVCLGEYTLVTEGAQKRHEKPWSRSYTQSVSLHWVSGTELRSSVRVAHTTEPYPLCHLTRATCPAHILPCILHPFSVSLRLLTQSS